MRTPEDIAFPYNRIIYKSQTGDEVTISAAIDILDVYDIIREAQTEAWNEALDAAVRNADTYWYPGSEGFSPSCMINENSILKLKR
jgi:hypothetical protein